MEKGKMASKMRMILGEGKSMSGEEIAQDMGTTRQYISNTLKSAMSKVYDNTKKMFPELTPYQVASHLVQILQIEDNEVANFYNLFPPKIREEIKKDAMNYLGTKRFKKSNK